MKKKLANIIPWLVAAGILYFLFRKIPSEDILGILKSIHLGYFIVLAVFYFLVMLVSDICGLHWLVNKYCCPITYTEIFRIRGYSFLVAIINYTAGQGSFAFYLKSKKKVPLFRALGAAMLFNFLDLFSLFVFAFGALLLDSQTRADPIKEALAPWIYVLFVMTFVWIVFWRAINHPRLKKIHDIKVFSLLFKNDMSRFFAELTLPDYLKALCWRLPVCLWAIIGLYFSIASIHMSIPMSKIYLYGPLVGLAGALPITPAGLGTTQILSVQFFSPWLSGPLLTQFSASHIILSVTLLWALANMMLKALMGLLVLIFGHGKEFSNSAV